MTRLAATLRCDVRLQLRNGFYWAVAFLLGSFALVVVWLPDFDWRPVMAPLVLGNLMVATFMFMAGLVLLEKDEGTLAAVSVTPLTPGEYLASKVVTLTALSVLENVALVLIAYGADFSPLPLVLGIALASAVYCLTGFVVVARYDSINEFLFPSVLYTTFLFLPILHYAGLWTTPLFYLHPLQPALVLLEGAFAPLGFGEWAYGIAGSAFWIAAALFWGRWEFRRLVAERAGASAG